MLALADVATSIRAASWKRANRNWVCVWYLTGTTSAATSAVGSTQSSNADR